MLQRSKIKEQELEDQLESLLHELEESEDNYDSLMDSFADSQRTVERMRADLNLGAQLVQKLQEEKVQLLEEIRELEEDNAAAAHDEQLSERLQQMFAIYLVTDDREENEMRLKTEVRKLHVELRDIRQANKSLERDAAEMEREINRLEGEKTKAQARCRTLENELRVTRQQVEELLSTNLDNENVIRMKVHSMLEF